MDITIFDLMREGIWLTIIIIITLIMPSLIVGLIVAIIQTATQINEQTLSFLPRLISIFITLFIAGPWVLKQLTNYANNLIEHIPLIIG